MAQYTRTTTVDASPSADTVKQAVLDVDTDLTGIVTAYNVHDTSTTAVHGLGSGTVCGTTNTQTLTNKTLSSPTLTGTVTASGATISAPTLTGTILASGATFVSPTITNATIQSSTFNGLNHTAATTGFTIAGGTTSKTLTVPLDASVSGTNTGDQNTELVRNLKPVVNVAVNKLDIFSKSGGAAPDATNIITVAIPDGNGYTFRSRAAAYLSGTGQIIMADAANYWSKGSLDGEIKTAYVYAIWDGTGIVWALGGYSGFTMVPTTTTATDDDYFLLEASSTYTRDNAHYCVAVAKIRYQYDTADTPDHTVQATVLNAPQVIWNPKSDYGYSKTLATTNTSAGNISDYSAISVVVKQSGRYRAGYNCAGIGANINGRIKSGSATYGSAVQKTWGKTSGPTQSNQAVSGSVTVYLNSGDTIHYGAAVEDTAGNRVLYGDDLIVGTNLLWFTRED